MNDLIDFQYFDSIDFRVGTIISANTFDQAIKPAYKLLIDFGPLGKLNSSAQITDLYDKSILINKQVIAAINIGDRQIMNFISQCLVLGASTKKGVVLLEPNLKLTNGSSIR